MKTTRTQKLPSVVMVLGLLATITTLAVDVGDPIYKKDVEGRFRCELLYEQYDRDMKIEYDDITLSGPRGQATGAIDDETDGADEDLFILRLSFLASDKVALYLDAGVLDDDEAESTPFIVGGGGRLLAYEKGVIRLNMVAFGHYVPPFDIEDDDTDSDLGRVEGTGEIDYYEVGAGMILSGDVDLGAGIKLAPYGGVLLSALRGSADLEVDFPDYAVTAKTSADIEEDDPLSGVAGISLLKDGYSLRVEGRFIGDSSVSVAVGAAF